jgi:AcrR family transcriptional regulator
MAGSSRETDVLAAGEGRGGVKAERTRGRLVEAACEVFARDGFIDARITDISATAGVAHGTFYTYFESKDDIFRSVVQRLQVEMSRDEAEQVEVDPDDLAGRIERGNRAYLTAYQRNASLMGTLEQVATFNTEMREFRRSTRQFFVDRTERAIRRWQREKRVDPELNPHTTASALCNMVDRFAYVWLVLGEPFEEEDAVETLTRLWCQALRLDAVTKRRKRRSA